MSYMEVTDMRINDALRAMAGALVLGSSALAAFADMRFLWITAFVGANLLQSGFTGWCPAMWLFRKLGMRG